jgi:hypothetical protein
MKKADVTIGKANVVKVSGKLGVGLWATPTCA